MNWFILIQNYYFERHFGEKKLVYFSRKKTKLNHITTIFFNVFHNNYVEERYRLTDKNICILSQKHTKNVFFPTKNQ